MAETVSAIRIDTNLKLKGLKKDLKELEKELKELEKHTASKDTQKQIDKKTKELEKTNKTIDTQAKKQQELNEKQKKARQQAEEKVAERGISKEKKPDKYWREVDNELDKDKGYQKAIDDELKVSDNIDTQLEKQKEITAEIERQQAQKQAQLESEYQQIDKTKEQIEKNEELTLKTKQRADEEIRAKENIERTTKGIKGLISRVVKLGLSVLGVRAAYSAIRKVVSSVTDDNEKLKNTIDGVWAGVGSAFEPMINGVIQGFATILNYALAIAKALTGINFISKANKKLAEKKSGSKSSNLASFDNSEVLSKSGSGSTTDNYLKEIELNEKLLGLVQKIKATLASYGDAIMPSLQRIWSAFKTIFGSIAEIVVTAINDILEIFEPVITWLFDVLAQGFEKLAEWLSNEEVKEGLTTLATLFLVVASAIALFNVVSALATGILGLLTSPLVIIAGLIALLITCFGDWGAVIDDVQLILDGLMNFITGVFTGNWKQAWNGIVQIFAGVWNGLIDIVQSVLNGITWAINKVIDGINALMSKIPDIFGISSWSIGHLTSLDITGFKYIPKLANGAVLPPNKPFIAQLGDQTNGRNLEAPEDLIRQIVREESGSGAITLRIIADSKASEFVRWLKFEIDEENKRVGTELVVEG